MLKSVQFILIYTKKVIMNTIKKIASLTIFATLTLYSNFWFQVTPLKNILYAHPEIQYIPCMPKTSLSFKAPAFHGEPKLGKDNDIFAEKAHPSKLTFDETFVLNIPQEKTYSEFGWIIIDNKFPQELI